jgi:hypothetical protein
MNLMIEVSTVFADPLVYPHEGVNQSLGFDKDFPQ